MSNTLFNILKFVVSVAIVCILVIIPFVWQIHKNYPKIGVINVTLLMQENEKRITEELFKPTYSADGRVIPPEAIPQDAVYKKTEEYVKRLEQAILDTEKECNCILMNEGVLLTQSKKVPNYTNKIRQKITTK